MATDHYVLTAETVSKVALEGQSSAWHKEREEMKQSQFGQLKQGGGPGALHFVALHSVLAHTVHKRGKNVNVSLYEAAGVAMDSLNH